VPAPAPEPKQVEAPVEATKPEPTPNVEGEAKEDREPLEMGGDLVPFGDPSWYQGVSGHTDRP